MKKKLCTTHARKVKQVLFYVRNNNIAEKIYTVLTCNYLKIDNHFFLLEDNQLACYCNHILLNGR